MKKTTKLTISVLGILALIGGTVVLSPLGNKKEAKSEYEDISKESKVSKEDLEKAEKEVGEINNEDLLTEKIITMSLQKVKPIGEKDNYEIAFSIVPERIEFKKQNIAYLQEKAKEINASQSIMKVLNKWNDEDYSSINIDHLSIRALRSKGYDNLTANIRTPEEENYVNKFFR